MRKINVIFLKKSHRSLFPEGEAGLRPRCTSKREAQVLEPHVGFVYFLNFPVPKPDSIFSQVPDLYIYTSVSYNAKPNPPQNKPRFLHALDMKI